ncbi:MAG: PD40 domain-containing protein [Paludibacteraceae bacterium]|nr:PD40 domain-containing protein [Paludibacteraceae bacterium]
MRKFIICIFGIILFACSKVDNRVKINQQPSIFPDYIGVTMPQNIAPPTFTVKNVDKIYAEFIFNGEIQFSCTGNSKRGISIPIRKWENLAKKAKNSIITVVVCTKEKDEDFWKEYLPFSISIASELIDGYITYRLIKPGYELWDRMGIYQRNITNYDEKAIFENRQQESKNGRGCINCHSFCEYNADTFMFHARFINPGTTIAINDEIKHLDLKTEITQNGTYPKWHPSARYIAYALCSTSQAFHVYNPNRISVYDTKSDLMIYDVQKKEVIVDNRFVNSSQLETFPSWSPDGKWLYFSSAMQVGNLPHDNDKIKYGIYRVSFNQETANLGDSIECIISPDSTNKTQLFARISPDNRYLLYTEADYGTFPIWHHEADLKMLDLESRQNVDTKILNSPSVESYHSWSSNGRWIVFSSRRTDRLYTRLYLAYFDENGHFHKPFLLPQKNANFDFERMYSYNIPEFTKGATKIPSYKIEKAVKSQPISSKLRK